MHVAVSWDISANQPTWGQINERLCTALGMRQGAKPVNTFYAVEVSGEADRQLLIASLQQACSGLPVTVHVVVTPLMRGRYEGIHNQQMWNALNHVTR